MWGLLLKAVPSVINSVVGVFTKKEQTKQLKATAETKLSHAKLNGETNITLSDSEWESIMASNMNGSWKDEYVTIVVTLPFPMLIAGGVLLAFTGDDRLMTGTVAGITALTTAGVDVGFMMTAVITAAVGLKVWRAK
jgi:hypothetical protein